MRDSKLSVAEDDCNILIDKTVFSKLSPLQRKILLALADGPLSLSDLSNRTGASIYTLGKQLSILQFRTKYNPLRGKGVSRPVVKKNKDAGIKTTYFLIPDRTFLNK